MRFSTKSSLVIVAGYLIVLAAIAFWLDRQLRSISREVLTETAHFVGREVAAALTEPTLQQVLSSDPAATANLERIVRELTDRSQLVTSMLVVDATGTVLAGRGESGRNQVALPRVVFGDDPRPRFITEGGAVGEQSFLLFVPLLQRQNIEGYLRLSLHSTRLSRFQARARRELLVAGGIGFLAVVVLSWLLQLQLARVGTALTNALQAVIRGETIREGTQNEFAPAFELAQRVGQELTAARERGAQAQRRLGSLMQVMDVGVILLNPDGEIIFTNQRARELLGGNNGAWDAAWNELREAVLPHIDLQQPDASSGTSLDVELKSLPRANRLRLEIYPREDEECGEYVILLKSRETLEALENELRLAIQMRGFARFYMAFAHDLKAPLNAMVMNLELLSQSLKRREESASEDERRQRYLNVVREEITRLDRYLQTLLRQAAPPSTASERFDVNDLIRDLATLLAPQAKQQKVTLETHICPEPVPFSGHRDRIKQALLNVAINALEAMPDGGALTMRLERSPDEARLSITDTGPGIPPELLKAIYQMHFTTKDGGTGIGLYVARSVVEAYEGSIEVESEPGRGTCFRVALPIPPGE